MKMMHEFELFAVLLSCVLTCVVCDSYKRSDSKDEKVFDTKACTETLVFVHAIFRHGNRTRDVREKFKNAKHNNESDWLPIGMGQLTPTGRNTEYQLGAFLRTRYNGFLSRAYYHKDIKVMSSHVYRAMESAQLVCAGLYSPPIGANKWGDGLGSQWQPVPVESIGDDDLWIDNHISCPPYDKEYEDVLRRQLVRENEENKNLYDLLAQNTGENVTTIREVAKIYNTLKCDVENEKSLPDWATPQLMSQLEPYRLLGFQVRTYSDLMKTIKAGPLFYRIHEIFNNKTREELKPDNKAILYSGHDTTLIAILNSLGATNQSPPEYGACLMIELHKINDEYLVQIYYLKSGLEHKVESVLLQDWKTNKPMPLKVFNNILSKYKISPKDWYKKCGKDQCTQS